MAFFSRLRTYLEGTLSPGILITTWWLFYFPGIFTLAILGSITIDIPGNVLLFCLALFPFSLAVRHVRLIHNVRNTMCFFGSIFLIWHESGIPGFDVLWPLISDPYRRFSIKVIFQFLYQTIDLAIFLGVASFFFLALFFATTRVRRYTPAVGLSVLLLSLLSHHPARSVINAPSAHTISRLSTQPPSTFVTSTNVMNFSSLSDPEDLYRAIVRFEQRRPIVVIPSSTPDPFDVIILQICSFGWDDFSVANVDMNPFFSQFDYIFTRFNSADSYSHTAAIRLLNGLCGLSDHEALFTSISPQCNILETLRTQGYNTATVFNHTGEYANFTPLLTTAAHIDAPHDIGGLTTRRIGFDNSPIYSDFDALNEWLTTRTFSATPEALFYNSIFLHAGNHYVDDAQWWKKSNEENYANGLNTFTDSMTNFFDALRKSNRRTIVLLVGEHGAGLRKTPFQLQTIREIPTPEISIVPAAIKLFGPGFNDRVTGLKIIDDRFISYQGLYAALGSLLNTPPTSSAQSWHSRMSAIPETPYFATGDRITVVGTSSQFYYKSIDGEWRNLPASVNFPKVPLQKSSFTTFP